jgi:ankyrin repeat protein/L-ascorbate metabolism protein UlaG (beta-lactamase superfamily)
VDAEKAPNRKTPLHFAAQGGHAGVVAFLLDKGAQVNRPNIAGETPLHYAVGLDDPATVAVLLARGADVRARTEDGSTPLQLAAAWGQMGSMTALLEKGADPRLPLPSGETLLHVAALVGPPEAIALFATRGVSVNAANPAGATPLLLACAAANVATARALIEQGADPNLRDAQGRQPLVLAARAGDETLVKRLLDAGATVVEGSTTDRRSALHVAAAAGYGRIASLLLARGADRNARDSQGLTPSALATRYGNTRIVRSLGGGTGLTGTSGRPSSAGRLLARPPRNGEATVWYLGHSGWAVRTSNHLLVFDYARSGRLPDDPSLANGMLVPSEIAGLPVTVFITHDHRDHYAPSLFDLRRDIKSISYLTGFRPDGKDGFVEMGARQTRSLGGLEVTTVESTDAGVGFLVRADGLTLFHGGDLCNARGEADGTFKREIDFLADRGLTADLYFAAARGCGQPEGIRKGIFYAVNRLSAKAVFPMHGGGREAAYAEFASEASRAGLSVPIHAAEFPGDRFTFAGQGVPGPTVAGQGAAPGGSRELDAVLRRAGDVVSRHARESTVILADETCQQTLYAPAVTRNTTRALSTRAGVVRMARRRWKAELARVLLPADGRHQSVPWIEVRDIYEVDGKPLPDRHARLERMTGARQPWTIARARAVVEENARFNLGPARRTINTPTIPLLVLNPPNQRRFSFDKAGEQRVGRAVAWQVTFREDLRPTLVRSFDGRSDLPMSGTLWVDPTSGEVVRAEMLCGPSLETRLSVRYTRHDRFDLALPGEMDERAVVNGSEWVEGKCTYSNFRRFETSGRLVPPGRIP